MAKRNKINIYGETKGKSPNVPTDPIERAWDSFNTHEKNIGYVPDVRYFFEVGEQIRYGALKECVVQEIYENGKIILFKYHNIGESYGKPYDNGYDYRVVWWHELEPIKTEKDTKLGIENKRFGNSLTTSLDAFIHTLHFRGFFDNPDYQRDYVWTLDDKRRLVKSLLDHSDIGKFVTLSHPWPENRLEIIDGKQRIHALLEFLEGKFTYEGYTWFEFSPKDKHIFMDNTIQFIELDNKHVKKSDIIWLFLSINHAGVPQTEEHIKRVKDLYVKTLREEEQNKK